MLEASELERKEGACPHFGVCGGCLYQRPSITKEQFKDQRGTDQNHFLDSVCKSYAL